MQTKQGAERTPTSVFYVSMGEYFYDSMGEYFKKNSYVYIHDSLGNSAMAFHKFTWYQIQK